MTRIPTKEELAKAAADKAAAAAKKSEDDAVDFFTNAIVAEMHKGSSAYFDRTRNISPAVEQRLRAAFAAQGYSLTVSNNRTGCSISWK